MPAAKSNPSISSLFAAEKISQRTAELAREIAARGPAGGGPLCLLALLQGAAPFARDLARELASRGPNVELKFITAQSYRGTLSTGGVRLEHAANLELAGRDVLIVDDILDTGLTLATVHEAAIKLGPARIASCVLLDKTSRRINGFTAEFIGFSCPDVFVVGYGMDLDGRYRELPFIGTISET